MFAVVTIIAVVFLLLGMFISVKAFGTGGKRAKVFENIYFSCEDVDGIGVILTKEGDYSSVLKMENPVRKYSADKQAYYDYTSLMASVLQTLGEGYALHKQDIFVRKKFDMSKVATVTTDKAKRFLSDSYFRFFDGRPYTDTVTYLIITQKSKKAGFGSFDRAKWNDFLVKSSKVADRLRSEEVKCQFLSAEECRDYADRYYAMDFANRHYAMTNFKVDKEGIGMGDRRMKIYSLLDVDDVGLPGQLTPFQDVTINSSTMSEDMMSELDRLEGPDTVVYNQVIMIPSQKKEIFKLQKKRNRHASLPNPNNQVAVEDINAVLDDIARNGRQLVYAHYNLVVTAPSSIDFQKVTNQLENILARNSINISKRAYNQLELFVATFPGNCFQLNEDYDRFLTLSEPALCLMYKERQAKGDRGAKVKCYYTDRQGVPMAIDTTGKENAVKYTDNSNFFVLGPSGSGKSFFMNTVMRQYYEQDTDIVIVDTGDSYEGLCSYFGGTYISYSKEHPISMNPFKITKEEYEGNFEEKKNFLKSLIFLIFRGTEMPSKLEDVLINETITEYYEAYFHPFTGFNDEDRKTLRQTLMLEDKKNGRFEDFEAELEKKYGDDYNIEELDRQKEEMDTTTKNRIHRLKPKLEALKNDSAATEGERQAAERQLMKLTPELVEGKYLQRLDHEIMKIEHQKKKLKVTDLSFNSYYEFALERLPQLMRQQNVKFDINNFAAILKPYYKGGERENTLNSDMDASLFDEKFIVFEIDKVKDIKDLFPIIVLIIMDVFTQKMRLKKGRKCLVIEEAWKAIATPVMADYIKYLYKTARKHWAMVGVVTQEIQDITSSPIVKDAIINNSGVFMLLDQSKFKDKFEDIKATLALTDNDCKKIFTINRLDNHEGRSPFKEVFIKRGIESDVYGVEEPPECYMNYTTEKAEKEALKLYRHLLHGTQQEAIEAFVRDWKFSGIVKSLDFAKRVLKDGKIYDFHSPQHMKA
ncbi:MAG: TraG family conjugative transposon ATPase [Prevotella sp.]|nr:TraG family conjugative transposon ATPase [Prevotella sp.]